MNIVKFFDLILDILYPSNINCFLCEMPISRKNKYSMCRKCFEELIFINNSCEVCGKPIISKNLEKSLYINNCEFCKDKSFLFDRNISFIEYGKLSSEIVFRYKYGNKTYIAREISKIMCDIIEEKYKNILINADYITYVPLSKKRFKERGFNQSEKIASYICKYFSLKLSHIVERSKDTKKLFGLNYNERKKELKNSFCINDEFKDDLNGKNIVIIDDIFTTGTTINEISKILKLKGVNSIVSMTFLTGLMS